MNRSKLIKEVADYTHVLQADVKKVLASICDTIIETVSDGEDVQLSGFGKFIRTKRSARSGKNSFTGKPFSVPAHHAPKFQPSKDFKESVY